VEGGRIASRPHTARLRPQPLAKRSVEGYVTTIAGGTGLLVLCDKDLRTCRDPWSVSGGDFHGHDLNIAEELLAGFRDTRRRHWPKLAYFGRKVRVTVEVLE